MRIEKNGHFDLQSTLESVKDVYFYFFLAILIFLNYSLVAPRLAEYYIGAFMDVLVYA